MDCQLSQNYHCPRSVCKHVHNEAWLLPFGESDFTFSHHFGIQLSLENLKVQQCRAITSVKLCNTSGWARWDRDNLQDLKLRLFPGLKRLSLYAELCAWNTALIMVERTGGPDLLTTAGRRNFFLTAFPFDYAGLQEVKVEIWMERPRQAPESTGKFEEWRSELRRLVLEDAASKRAAEG